ncbi:ribosomal RNA small subunit methyltransferase A [Leptospira ognonensis]|uniref:Ribosomal RNA small subunit methyltransferase A n=1 Tax=Leptospira ognonensis TaxID=2484945 RepID=A0A4R9JX86_9LEPT|nr:16S rRNA (adenine(1518)-N(6)/adenine(1519)-N(6))-dimethyltransferase RsmA [Leptospira ognonensis]TGL56684.1 ribosomal RNA small subunit methyltransferase A [Leptospira ognonensis]
MQDRYTTPTEIQSFLSTNGLNAQKKFGQNFLVDQNIVKFIIEKAKPIIFSEPMEIAEIGIGLGTLTYPILEMGLITHLFEIDHAYIQLAKDSYLKNFINGKLYPGDALENLNQISNIPIFVFGNLPYHLTTEIITTISTDFSDWKGGLFMVQKEFAERLTGEISSLSVFLEAIGKTTLLKHVNKKCFYPAPKIDSSLILLLPHASKDRIFKNKNELAVWSRMLRSFFWGKRKQMQVSLRESPFSQDPIFQAAVSRSMEAAGISPKTRPEELNRKQFLNLGQELLDSLSN